MRPPPVFSCRYAVRNTSPTLPLFAPHELPTFRRSPSAMTFLQALLLNRNIVQLLQRLPSIVTPIEWWLTSGCLVQTVWNVRSGFPAERGILDYDLFYFDPDTSWKAEDRFIRTLEDAVSDLPINMQPRNQARVHLWYRDKFGIRYPPVRSARHALRRFPATTTAVGISTSLDGRHRFYAPFGLSDALKLVVKPNRRLPAEDVYRKKAARWKRLWRNLTVYDWDGQVAKSTYLQKESSPKWLPVPRATGSMQEVRPPTATPSPGHLVSAVSWSR